MNPDNLRKFILKRIKDGVTEERIRDIPLIKKQDCFAVDEIFRELQGDETIRDNELKKAKINYEANLKRLKIKDEHKKKLAREKLYDVKVVFRVDGETANKLHTYGHGYRAEVCRRGLKLFFEKEAEDERRKQEEGYEDE